MKYKSYVECPRWARFATTLRARAYDLQLDVQIHIDKGLLRETVFFELEGDQGKIKQLMRELDVAIVEWNRKS